MSLVRAWIDKLSRQRIECTDGREHAMRFIMLPRMGRGTLPVDRACLDCCWADRGEGIV